MKQLKNQRGLTLVELLAVVVILAIIAAIAAVAIGNVINNSKDKAALSDAVMVIEGAKLANLDGACTEADSGVITCTKEELEAFVDADLENDAYYGKGVKDTIATYKDNKTGWELKKTKAMENIKNKKYQVEGDPVSERAIKAVLKGNKDTTTNSGGGQQQTP